MTFKNRFFGPLSQEPWAQEIWAFLNEDDSIRRMEAASALGRPALEGVVIDLEQGWGDHLGSDQARKMVGAMIKEVMEPRGWEIESQGLKMQYGHQFSVATRYQQRANPGATPPTGGFLSAVAKRYGVPHRGRHYILIPCSGVTIGVDELKSTGLRRVHFFADRKSQAAELSSLVPHARKAAPPGSPKELLFVDRHGAKDHERRYVGWEWKSSGRTVAEDVEFASALIETLRQAWLSRP